MYFGSAPEFYVNGNLVCLFCSLQLLLPTTNEKKRRHKGQQNPVFMAEPMRASNSFVGTEEYIAPVSDFAYTRMTRYNYLILVSKKFYRISTVSRSLQEIIAGAGHTSAVDWWALGNYFIFFSEMKQIFS